MNVFDEKVSLGPVAKMYIKNSKLILIAVVCSTILATIVSFMLTPRYIAKTTFFIPFNISYDLAVENPQFGYDVEADRLLQILKSEQLKDSVAKRFDLVNYYDLDTTKFDWKDDLSEKYARRISCNRTNVMSIEIAVETHDPYFSKEIVQYILDLSQRMRERMLKTNSTMAVDVFKGNYLEKLAEVDSIGRRIIKLRKESKASPIALLNSQILFESKNNATILDPEVAVELEVLSQKHINEYNRLNELKGKYENALNVLNRPVPKFYMLDVPTPIFKKVFPLIGFNITVAFLGSLFFMLSGLYLLYVVKTIKKYVSSN